MAEIPDAYPYYYDDSKQENLEKLIENFQNLSDVNHLDKINIFSQNDITRERERVPRLNQAIVRLSSITPLDLQKYQILYRQFAFNVTNTKGNIEYITERLTNLTKPFVKSNSYSIDTNWLKQRNVCFVMAIVTGIYGEFDLKYFTNNYLDYFLKIIENVILEDNKQIENLTKEAVLYGVICLDNLFMNNWRNEKMNLQGEMMFDLKKCIENNFPMFVQIKDPKTKKYFKINFVKIYEMNKTLKTNILKKLEILSQFTDQDIYSFKFESIFYQIGFLYRWNLDHHAINQNKQINLDSSTKILDFSARNFRINEYHCAPVQSAFEVTSGVFYYEVILLTCGSIRIGWATNAMKFTDEPKKGLGEDAFSIGFEGYEGCVWHVKKRIIEKFPPWKPLDVIGCLIDMTQQKFSFYLNGEEIQFNCENVHFCSSLSYFATVTLSPHQQCIFNFGQTDFKYAPEEINPNNFHNSTQGDEQKYRLLGFELGRTFYGLNKIYFREKNLTSEIFVSSNNENQIHFDQFIEAIFDRKISYVALQKFLNKFEDLITRHGLKILNHSLNNDDIRMRDNFLEHINQLVLMFCISERRFYERIEEFIYLFMGSIQAKDTELNNEFNRNFCLTSLLLVDWKGLEDNIFCYFDEKLIVENLLNTIDRNTNFELTFLAILTLEAFKFVQVILEKPFSDDLSKRIIEIFEKHTIEQIDAIQLVQSTDSDQFLKYQIGFCAKWHLDNHVSKNIIKKRLPLKLSNNLLDVRNDYVFDLYVRSSTEAFVSGKIYYYEIILITEGYMRFGWATREFEFLWGGIGTDKFSIGVGDFFDINHQKTQCTTHYSSQRPCFQRGDVIGCLLNLATGKFAFYVNGYKLKFKEEGIHFSNQPYFACANIALRQQCRFNFGQEPFVHLPQEYANICELKDQAGKHATLLKPNNLREKFWFKLKIENVIFRDETQIKFDEFITDLENRVTDNNYCYEDCEQLSINNFVKLMKIDTQTHLRLIQTIIENLGTICLKNENENLVQHELLAIVEHLQSIETKPDNRHLLEMFYPYLQTNSDDLLANPNKARNICIALSLYWKDDEDDLNKVLYDEAKQFLLNVIKNSDNNLTLLYAIICFEKFSMNDSNKKDITQQNWKRFSELSDYVNLVTCENLYESNADYIKYQVGFCSNWFNEKIVSIENQTFDTKEMNPATLNPRSATKHLKLSPDLLSARSNFGRQSVFCNFLISTGVYYYEIILLTSGSMLIGWNTKNDDQIMSDRKKSNLIAMDGYIKVISDCGESESLESEFKSWKFGDVVGCLIDCQKHKFVFYINGKQIYCKENDEDFSNYAYFAYATLSSSQHCYFNFGQSKFKFAPILIFKDFYEKVYNDNICQLCTLKPALGRARTECCQLKACYDCLNEPICSNCQTA